MDIKTLLQYNKKIKSLDLTLYKQILKEFDRKNLNSLVNILYNQMIIKKTLSPKNFIQMICNRGKRPDGSSDLVFVFLNRFIKNSIKLDINKGVFIIGHLTSLYHSVNVGATIQDAEKILSKLLNCFKIQQNVNIKINTNKSNKLYTWISAKKKDGNVNFIIDSVKGGGKRKYKSKIK